MVSLAFSKLNREKGSPEVIVLLVSLFPQAWHLANHRGCDSSPLSIALLQVHSITHCTSTRYSTTQYTLHTVQVHTVCTLTPKTEFRTLHTSYIKHRH